MTVRGTKVLLFATGLALLCCAQAALQVRPTVRDPECVCIALFAPVCGADGKTYGNSCEAGCAKVAVVAQGECPKPPSPGSGCIAVTCSSEPDEVCGTDGKTYINDCLASCEGASVAYKGKCLDREFCKLVRCSNASTEVVCGKNGVTYGNPCAAVCGGGTVVVAAGPCVPKSPSPNPASPKPSPVRKSPSPNPASPKPSPVPSPCPCPKNLAPVCGTDGKTYGNACLAICAKVPIASDGACPTTPSRPPCVCTREFNPVCGIICNSRRGIRVCIRKTYSNRCVAKCAGAKVDYKGSCLRPGSQSPKPASPSPKPDGCICPLIYLPVCGVDGKTYGNACQARCAGVEVAATGECKPVDLNIPCAAGDPGAQCLVDPCGSTNTNKCVGRPGLTCLSFYCVKPVIYRGYRLVGPCSAIYLVTQTGDVAKECL